MENLSYKSELDISGLIESLSDENDRDQFFVALNLMRQIQDRNQLQFIINDTLARLDDGEPAIISNELGRSASMASEVRHSSS